LQPVDNGAQDEIRTPDRTVYSAFDDLLMKRQYLRWMVCIAMCLAQTPGYANEIVGWLETVTINTGDLRLVAKLDTGAKTTSLGYESIRFFQRDGRDWVSVSVTGKKNKTLVLEKEVIRYVNIKQHVGEAMHRRPVIMLGICLKDVYKKVEVDLTDRGGFNYTLLIGRNFLVDEFVVNPHLKFTQKPHCSADKR
jgi:hypothetical protein